MSSYTPYSRQLRSHEDTLAEYMETLFSRRPAVYLITKDDEPLPADFRAISTHIEDLFLRVLVEFFPKREAEVVACALSVARFLEYVDVEIPPQFLHRQSLLDHVVIDLRGGPIVATRFTILKLSLEVHV